MYSSKQNILQLVALMREFEIRDVVLCPGSRNAPLSKTFAACNFFHCHAVTDERSAGFQAIGMIEATNRPVAICCTSGSALLNIAPSVTEAYYQKLPLLVISADRPAAWIGQMDGQTIVQPEALKNFCTKSIALPEINSDEEEWFCNRLINEALLCLTGESGCVHINIPISEPLFDFSVQELPKVRKINANINRSIYKWESSQKPMIIVGQMLPNNDLDDALRFLVEEKHCVVLCEHLANVNLGISNFNEIDLTPELVPDFLVTIGGHIVSKKLKQFLRKNKPNTHWHISKNGEIADTYQCLTDVLRCSDIASLLISLGEIGTKATADFQNKWIEASKNVVSVSKDYSEEYAVASLLMKMPSDCALQLANSSAVRLALKYALPQNVKVFCNRGTNGIEGSLSAAVGYANASGEKTFLVIGDLSFFYDINSLMSLSEKSNLHILLLNNNGGKIFENLLPMDDDTQKYVAAKGANITAEKWAETIGLTYISAENQSDFDKKIDEFINLKSNVLLELNFVK